MNRETFLSRVKSTRNIGKELVSWNLSRAIQSQVNYFYNETDWLSEFLEMEDLKNAGEVTIREKIWEYVLEDNSLLQCEYDDTINYFSEILQKKDRNKSGGWHIEVSNFGWQKKDGYKYCYAENANELLGKVLPDTNCFFTVFNYGAGIAIQNFHHDSPYGDEWYYITNVKESTVEKNLE